MLRALVSVGMNLAGMILVFVAVLTPAVSVNLQLQVIIVLIGILLVQGSVWKFTNPFLPSERKYDDLRNEVDDFIDLVRDLNEAAISSKGARALDQADKIERVLSKMHISVDQMGRLAGREISFAYLPEPLEELADGRPVGSARAANTPLPQEPS